MDPELNLTEQQVKKAIDLINSGLNATMMEYNELEVVLEYARYLIKSHKLILKEYRQLLLEDFKL